MDLNCSICRIASNRVPLPCSSPNFHLDATKSNANIKNNKKCIIYKNTHILCKEGIEKTSGAETEFKFDAWKSRWQVLIGFQFCNTHTWFHQTFLSQRNLETFMYHSGKETERKKTQQRRNSLLVTIEVNK